MDQHERQTDKAMRREARRASRVSKRRRRQDSKGALTWKQQARELRKRVA